ncbi:hypothetical protein ACOMHN_035381 [Nucella lapillus]
MEVNCTPDPTSRFATLDPAFLTYYLGVLGLVCVVNLGGNVLVLRTVYRHRCLWIPANVFICSLATSDLLFAPIFYLYNVAGINTAPIKDFFGDWWVCRILLMETLALEICSAYTLVAITGLRYIGSAYALRYHHYATFRNCNITVAVIWLTSHTVCIMVYAMQNPEAVHSGAYCRLCRYEAIYTERELGLLTVLQFALPFTLMLLFYLKMLCQARRLVSMHSLLLNCCEAPFAHIDAYLSWATLPFTLRRSARLAGCTMESQQSRATIRQRQHKSFIIITLLIGCFAVSYLPLIGYFFVVIFEGKPKTDYEYLSATSRIFMAFNTAVNVFIYAGRMSDFRHCLHRDLASSCSCLAKCSNKCSNKCSSSSSVTCGVATNTSFCPAAPDVNVVTMTSPPQVAAARDTQVVGR